MASTRNGVNEGRKWVRSYMGELGFEFVAPNRVTEGRKAFMLKGELPAAPFAVALSGRSTTKIDGVVSDAYDPNRASILIIDGGGWRTAHRCVFGYWKRKGEQR